MDKTTHPRSQLTPLMLLVFFFVLCCGVLACVFARAADLSVQAGQLNSAVQLCRSGAEVFSASGSAEQTYAALGGMYFDSNGDPATEEEAELYLTIREQTASGIRQAVFSVCTMDDELVYTLTASAFPSQIPWKEGEP